jgi:hypothetical protein
MHANIDEARHFRPMSFSSTSVYLILKGTLLSEADRSSKAGRTAGKAVYVSVIQQILTRSYDPAVHIRAHP